MVRTNAPSFCFIDGYLAILRVIANRCHPPDPKALVFRGGSFVSETLGGDLALKLGKPSRGGACRAAPDHAEEELADVTDDPVPTRAFATLPMVGLGGSAGGIAALQGFFAAAPADSGMVFVVVMHLSSGARERSRADPAALDRDAGEQVQERVKVKPNHVYVIPPGKTLRAARTATWRAPTERRARPPRRGRPVLPHPRRHPRSARGGDRPVGRRRRRRDRHQAHQGARRADDRAGPDEAEHAGMPRSAIATGMVDWVLPVAEMPERLRTYFELETDAQAAAGGRAAAAQPQAAPDDDEAALREVLAYLRSRTGRDFSYYKRATIVRRIGAAHAGQRRRATCRPTSTSCAPIPAKPARCCRTC